MTYHQHRKIKLELTEPSQKTEGVSALRLLLQISYCNSTEKSTESKNTFVLDDFGGVIESVKKHEEALNNSEDSASMEGEFTEHRDIPIDVLLETLQDVKDSFERWFSPQHPIYRGECTEREDCPQKNSPFQPGELGTKQPCTNKDCPHVLTSQDSPENLHYKTVPSSKHYQELDRFHETVRGYSEKYSEIEIYLTFLDDQSDLHKYPWQRLPSLLVNPNRISISIVKNIKTIKREVEENLPFDFTTYSQDNPLKIVVIYLNNLYNPKSMKDGGQTANEDEIQKQNQDWQKFIEKSQEEWLDFDHKHKWVEVICVTPTDGTMLRRKLNNNYDMAFVIGHGPFKKNDQDSIRVGNQLVSVDHFVDSLQQSQRLKIICFASCFSTQLARKLHKSDNLIMSFRHKLAIDIIYKLEKSIRYKITREQNESKSWHWILSQAVRDLMTDGDKNSVSLNSFEIYQEYNCYLFLKQKTIQQEPITTPPPPPPNEFYWIRMRNFCRQNWLFLLLFIVVLLAGLGLVMWLKPNTPTVLRQSNIYVKEAGGFLLSKKKNGNNNYIYYAVVAVSKDSKNGTKTEIVDYNGEKFQATIVDELENKLQPDNQTWKLVIVSFEQTKEIEMPKFSLESIAVEGESFEIWGYEPIDKYTRNLNYREIRGNANDESIKNTPFVYQSSETIENEFIGSPIVNKSRCVIGLHIEKNTQTKEQSDYRGQLFSNIQKSLKESKNPELKKVAENMQSCSL
ncbi:hypothetical protein [Microcystis aeruginosa]|uniref:Uncharacterized protein n=1 Tax=Microcystis aeruginosa PCC 9701 TaxID=721123 RepID=I4INQ2_MICAE|nr:hypothetical protein [Microcystis aeruginosa]CCI35926.1 hypothetical protein MICAK_210003 [Microcystis aeruginosa PCC 9701]